MKKVFMLFVPFAILLGIVACHSNNTSVLVSSENNNIVNKVESKRSNYTSLDYTNLAIGNVVAESNMTSTINVNTNDISVTENRTHIYPQLRIRLTDYLTSPSDYLKVDYTFNSYYVDSIKWQLVYGYPGFSDYYNLDEDYPNIYNNRYGGTTLINARSVAFDSNIVYRYLVIQYDNLTAMNSNRLMDNTIIGSINITRCYNVNGVFTNELTDNNNTYQDGYDTGYDLGYDIGYNVGKTDTITNDYQDKTYNQIYHLGYNNGYSAADDNDTMLPSLFGSIVNIPISVLNGLAPLTFFDISIIRVVISFMALGVILWIIRKVFK